MRFIERYSWLHVFIISLIGAGLIAAAAHFFMPGEFTARSSLLLNDRPDIIASLASPDGGAANVGPALERLQAILISRTIRERIIEQLSLKEKFQTDEGETLEALTDMSVIKNIGQDGLAITVTVGGYFAPDLPQLGHPIPSDRNR